MMGVDFAMLFPLQASGFAFGYDPTSLLQLRPKTSGKPEDFRFCVAERSKSRATAGRLHPQTPPHCGMKLLY